MPIEIRELVIRAYIEEADAAKDLASDSRLGSISFAETDAIIRTCVEQVMKILEDKKER